MFVSANAAVAPQVSDATMGSGFADRLQQSFTLFAELVPAFFGALVILFAGYLVAKVVEKGTQRLLRRLRFNQLLERGGVMQAVDRGGAHLNPARVIANLLFWVVMFAVLLVAANAIGLESLANVLSELVSYIPSVIAAVVIIILGIVLGSFVGGLIMASAGGLHGGSWLARIGRGGVIILAIFMALQELGIATEIVTTAFAILFGAVALALALSFGLGNRELAAQVTREWYENYRAERLAIERGVALEEAEELAQERTQGSARGAGRGASRRKRARSGAGGDVAADTAGYAVTDASSDATADTASDAASDTGSDSESAAANGSASTAAGGSVSDSEETHTDTALRV